MIIVAGALFVDPAAREEYLSNCRSEVEQARAHDECLDFALSGDLVDPGRINVYERWIGEEGLSRFRGSGPSADQAAAIRSAEVQEFLVDG